MEGRYDPGRYREVRQPSQCPEAEAIEDAIASIHRQLAELGVISLRVRQHYFATSRAAPPTPAGGTEAGKEEAPPARRSA